MNDRDRAQIALILQRATKLASAQLDERIRGIYAEHAAKGSLRSGATIRVAVKAMGDILSPLIDDMAPRIFAVAGEKAAFDELNIAVRQILDAYHERLSGVVRTASGRPAGQSEDRAVVSAAETLFNNWRVDLEGQLAILAFDFDAQPNPAEEAAVPSATAAAKKGGRPTADFWDDMWAAIAVSLYVGDIEPKSQADVERAMLSWIEGQGRSAAVSTVRARARRLWDRMSAVAD